MQPACRYLFSVITVFVSKFNTLTREASTVDHASFEMVEFKFRTGQHTWQQESGFDRKVLALEVWILVSGFT